MKLLKLASLVAIFLLVSRTFPCAGRKSSPTRQWVSKNSTGGSCSLL